MHFSGEKRLENFVSRSFERLLLLIPFTYFVGHFSDWGYFYFCRLQRRSNFVSGRFYIGGSHNLIFMLWRISSSTNCRWLMLSCSTSQGCLIPRVFFLLWLWRNVSYKNGKMFTIQIGPYSYILLQFIWMHDWVIWLSIAFDGRLLLMVGHHIKFLDNSHLSRRNEKLQWRAYNLNHCAMRWSIFILFFIWLWLLLSDVCKSIYVCFCLVF